MLNVLPPGAPDKGSALRELLAQRPDGCAIYAGDDDTDEHVFDLPPDLVLGVRVGQDPSTRAALYVDEPHEMLPLEEPELVRANLEGRALHGQVDHLRRLRVGSILAGPRLVVEMHGKARPAQLQVTAAA